MSEKNTNKLKNLHVYILCNNRQIKEFDVSATRKFNIENETYVIKDKCCYFKMIDGIYKEISFYIEGNPNPFNLNDVKENKGLDEKELDRYVGADLFNIILECQKTDRSKYILQLVSIVFIFSLISFISTFF